MINTKTLIETRSRKMIQGGLCKDKPRSPGQGGSAGASRTVHQGPAGVILGPGACRRRPISTPASALSKSQWKNSLG